MLKYKIATGQAETDILTEYGVHVSSSTGMVGRPDFKNPQKFNWDYLNGECIDLHQRRYKPREIRLKCWLKANNKQTAIDNLSTFLKAFDTQNLIRLHVEFVDNNGGQVVIGNKGLFFLVYLSKIDSKQVKWRQGSQILTFDITLIEPSPIKRVISVGGSDIMEITVAYNSSSEFDIYWGDGDVAYDCLGNGSVQHAYSTSRLHYIIMTGVIGDISSMNVTASSNEIVITQIYDEI